MYRYRKDPEELKKMYHNIELSKESKRILLLAATEPEGKFPPRFAIVLELDSKNQKTLVRLCPSLPANATPADVEAKQLHYQSSPDGPKVVVQSEPVLTGRVHEQVLDVHTKLEQRSTNFKDNSEELDNMLGLGMTLGDELTIRSTMQYKTYDVEELMRFVHAFDPEEFEFKNGQLVSKLGLEHTRDYNKHFHMRRSPPADDSFELKNNLNKAIVSLYEENGLTPPNRLTSDTRSSEIIRDQLDWEQPEELESKKKKEKTEEEKKEEEDKEVKKEEQRREITKKGLTETIYIASNLAYCKPGEFWDGISDAKRIKRALDFAKQYGIQIDVNAIPEAYAKNVKTTALMGAVRKGNIGLVKLLIKAGADVSLVDEQKKTALDYAKETEAKLAAEAKELKKSEGFLEQLKNAINGSNWNSVESLMVQIRDKYPHFCEADAFQDMAFRLPKLLQSQRLGLLGDFPLGQTDPDAVKFLKLLDVFEKTIDESVNMAFYLEHNLFSLFYFIENGKEAELKQALQEKKEYINPLLMYELFVDAISKENISLGIINLLVTNGLNLNNVFENDTPLTLALRKKPPNPDIIKSLLDHKANPNQEAGGEIPLLIALKNKCPSEILTLLLPAEANNKLVHLFNSSRDEEGNPVLTNIAQRIATGKPPPVADIKFINLLLEIPGIDIATQDSKGNSYDLILIDSITAYIRNRQAEEAFALAKHFPKIMEPKRIVSEYIYSIQSLNPEKRIQELEKIRDSQGLDKGFKQAIFVNVFMQFFDEKETKMFLLNDLKPKNILNFVDLEGNSLLHLAALQKKKEIVDFLFQHGASPLVLNSSDKKPYEVGPDTKINSLIRKKEDEILTQLKKLKPNQEIIKGSVVKFSIFKEGKEEEERRKSNKDKKTPDHDPKKPR